MPSAGYNGPSVFSKFRAFMKNTLISVLVAAGLAGGFTTASAEKADRAKPMNIESDTLRYDDLNQVSIFTGRVVLTKGTIVIRGAQIEVRQDADGYQYGLVTGSPDKRAFFRQKREALDEFIEGEGETIYLRRQGRHGHVYQKGPVAALPGYQARR